MKNEPSARPMEIRCRPCDGGFEVAISAAAGLGFWLEYYVLGGGGYRESGEITGRITAEPEVIRRRVSVPVIEVGIASISLGSPRQLRARPLELRKPSALDRRPIPDGAVELLDGNDPETGSPLGERE